MPVTEGTFAGRMFDRLYAGESILDVLDDIAESMAAHFEYGQFAATEDLLAACRSEAVRALEDALDDRDPDGLAACLRVLFEVTSHPSYKERS